LPAGLLRVPARPPPADGGAEPGEAEDDPGGLPEYLLAVQHRRGDVRQLAALEEPAAADVFDGAVGGGAGRETGGGVGRQGANTLTAARFLQSPNPARTRRRGSCSR